MNQNKNKDIWILAEYSDGKLNTAYKELLTKAKDLAVNMENSRVCSVVLGHKVDSIVKEVENSGADIVYSIDNEKLAIYNIDYYTAALEQLNFKYKPDLFLIGATARGSEIAPTLAARLHTGLAAHCIDIKLNEDNNAVCLVPAFGGKVISEILIPDHRPQMASVRPGILDAKEFEKNPDIEIIKYDAKLDDVVSGIVFESFVPTQVSTKKLEEAEIVICAGRGVTTEETWDNINKLAEKLNASIGYTRCLIDRGFVEDESDMIGTSGKSIKPKIYLGIGVSGATHHVCGMTKSGMIININRDKNAKIFGISDYKVVGDSKVMVDALLEKLS